MFWRCQEGVSQPRDGAGNEKFLAGKTSPVPGGAGASWAKLHRGARRDRSHQNGPLGPGKDKSHQESEEIFLKSKLKLPSTA